LERGVWGTENLILKPMYTLDILQAYKDGQVYPLFDLDNKEVKMTLTKKYVVNMKTFWILYSFKI
jgi:hypothetical protein